jgi:ADP-ribosylglycohydrolase
VKNEARGAAVDDPERARAAFYGLAIGDALGMPTQMLSRPQIKDRWGDVLTRFEPAPDGHPIAAGQPAGAVTDDTEQAVLLARLLIKNDGRIDTSELASALSAWERDMERRGSLDLLGPSTKRAVAAVLAGTPPEEAGATGDTNGAAMRITPVGIAVDLERGLPAMVDQVEAASRVTHDTSIALAGAAAVATAVSAGINGSTVAEATRLAVLAARLGATRGHWVAGADVAARIEWATGLVADLAAAADAPSATDAAAIDQIYTLVGTSLATQESVPAAFAVLAAIPDDPWRACLMAASLGGDTDTIAAMAGAIGGACNGMAGFPPHAIEVADTHGFGLGDLADRLARLRSS